MRSPRFGAVEGWLIRGGAHTGVKPLISWPEKKKNMKEVSGSTIPLKVTRPRTFHLSLNLNRSITVQPYPHRD